MVLAYIERCNSGKLFAQAVSHTFQGWHHVYRYFILCIYHYFILPFGVWSPKCEWHRAPTLSVKWGIHNFFTKTCLDLQLGLLRSLAHLSVWLGWLNLQTSPLWRFDDYLFHPSFIIFNSKSNILEILEKYWGRNRECVPFSSTTVNEICRDDEYFFFVFYLKKEIKQPENKGILKGWLNRIFQYLV